MKNLSPVSNPRGYQYGGREIDFCSYFNRFVLDSPHLSTLSYESSRLKLIPRLILTIL